MSPLTDRGYQHFIKLKNDIEHLALEPFPLGVIALVILPRKKEFVLIPPGNAVTELPSLTSLRFATASMIRLSTLKSNMATSVILF